MQFRRYAFIYGPTWRQNPPDSNLQAAPRQFPASLSQARTHARTHCSPQRHVADRSTGQSTILTFVGNLFLSFVCRFDGESFRASGGLMQCPSNVFLAYHRHNTKHAKPEKQQRCGNLSFRSCYTPDLVRSKQQHTVLIFTVQTLCSTFRHINTTSTVYWTFLILSY
jgi:hypothetical protein